MLSLTQSNEGSRANLGLGSIFLGSEVLVGFPQTAWQYALLERGLSGYTAPDLQPKTTLDVPPAARHFAKFEIDFLLGWCWLNTLRA